MNIERFNRVLGHQQVLEQAMEFMSASGQPLAHVPSVPPLASIQVRLRMLFEEAFELLAACGAHSVDVDAAEEWVGVAIANMASSKSTVDLVAVYDALLDIDYINAGNFLTFGMDPAPGAAEVHRTNMAKSVNGVFHRREDGKILKPPGWEPPNLRRVLIEQGWEP